MEVHLDKPAVKLIRVSAQDAIEEGDTEALREDILEAFSEILLRIATSTASVKFIKMILNKRICSKISFRRKACAPFCI